MDPSTDVKELPSSPSLEQYKKQAKDLVKGRKSGDPASIRRIKEHHPRLGMLSDSELRSMTFALADAQFIIAREHGFESWPKFAKHIEALTSESFPNTPFEAAENAIISGDVATLERLLLSFRANPEPRHWYGWNQNPLSIQENDAFAGARSIILREHCFDSWSELVQHNEALMDQSSLVSKFESAVDAIITGDVATLELLLREQPELVRARSTRRHRATLLHYVGANGVEGFRQKTPKNAVQIMEILLRAGAEVDAVADMYGKDTTLALVATSIHPLRAGVQIALIETLLGYDAAVDGVPGGGAAVNACLANGRPEAAAFLAAHGGRLDLQGAAGVGRLDLVKSFFNENGSLKANVTKAQMGSGFMWACEYGRTSVVDFLLQRGVDVGAQDNHGQTGLHWAAIGGQLETITLLLARKAPLEVVNDYGGTVLGQATWSAIHEPQEYHALVIQALLDAGARVEAAGYPTGNERIDEMLRQHGAK